MQLLGGGPHYRKSFTARHQAGVEELDRKVESRADQGRGQRDRFLYNCPRESAKSQIFRGCEHKLPLPTNRAIC